MGNYKSYDLMLKNLVLVDGTGNPAYRGDVAINGDTIAAVGRIEGDAATVLDLDGLYASPGFIDIHNHSDKSIYDDPAAKNYTAQGVTTLTVGNCGYSGAPIADRNVAYLEAMGFSAKEHDWSTFAKYVSDLDRHEMAVNIAPLVGHGNLRGAVMGVEARKPTEAEFDRMKALLQEALDSGAFGMSSGLIYDPGLFADTEELAGLSRLVARAGGIYASHIRNESDLLVESVFEAIRIGKLSGARVQISHHKTSGKRNWGLVRTTLDLMEYYRRFGVEVSCDVYPCTMCQTNLYSFFPNWSRDGGKTAFLSLLRDEGARLKIRSELSRPSEQWENILLDAGFDETIVSDSVTIKQFEGKSLSEIACELGKSPYDALFEVIQKDPDIEVVAGGMSEEDVKYVLKHPLSMVSSDGSVMLPGVGVPHPRSYRAFTKVLQKYARDEKELTLETAIRKMTSMPAWKLGIQDRGLLKPGMKADIAVFDLWNVAYRSEFRDPHHYSEGMVHVLVNGGFIIRDGAFTGATPGKALRRGG